MGVSDHPQQDEWWMQQALDLALSAGQSGEVPVGAVVVYHNQVIGRGSNQSIHRHDPTAHAEVVALRQAGEWAANYRLVGCTVYVTLEPCAMCVGALAHARIARLVYGADDLKRGAVQSKVALQELPLFNHRFECHGGVMAQESRLLLQQFFQARRQVIF